MRSSLSVALLAVLVAAACSAGDETVAVESTTTAAVVETPTTTTSSAVRPPTTLPSTVTVVPEGAPYAAAIEVLSQEWSTIELWRDGWVEIAATATGAPVPTRDSEMGRLFPNAVHDAIEAAGATDMLAAYDAIASAGLVTEVLAVFEAHPEVREAVLSGPATVAVDAAVTTDGLGWEIREIPHLATGGLRASTSDGEHLALLFGDLGGTTLHLATTGDLDHWTVTPLEAPFTAGVGSHDLVMVGDQWLVTTRDGETTFTETAWIVADDQAVRETDLPGHGPCCELETTSAGVFAYVGDHGEPSAAWFSADGIAWQEREVPGGQRITGAASVRDGLVISTRDDAAVASYWRGTPEGDGWVATGLPDEIEWGLTFFDNNHEGIAQFVAVPGWGQRGYQPPLPSVTFEVEHDGLRFDFAIGAPVSDGPFALTVTDPGTGVVVFDRAGPFVDPLPPWARTAGTDLEFFDENDEFVVAVPLEPVEVAYAVALDEAAAASRTPVENALLTSTYLLYSLDGIDWSSRIIEPAGESFTPWFAASINGSRALKGDGDGGYRLIQLDEG